jgi:hypothetical protein
MWKTPGFARRPMISTAGVHGSGHPCGPGSLVFVAQVYRNGRLRNAALTGLTLNNGSVPPVIATIRLCGDLAYECTVR